MNQSDDFSPSHRVRYERSMHKVLTYIDAHLDAELDLALLAEVAHFSPFHFHRLFYAWMGETLGDYRRRRRIEFAARKLVSQPKLSVLDIALSVGFSSGEAFARAFKQRFEQSPSSWRVTKRRQPDRNLDQAFPQKLEDNTVLPILIREQIMQVKIVERDAVKVAYLRHTGPYGIAINAFWKSAVVPWLAQHQLFGQPCFGIGYDDPSITAPEQCRYDACVTLPEGFVVPREMLTTIIPGGRYAVLPFRGTVNDITPAWQGLMREWLPASGYQLDARPCFEAYPVDETYDPNSGIFSCEICIPIADFTKS